MKTFLKFSSLNNHENYQTFWLNLFYVNLKVITLRLYLAWLESKKCEETISWIFCLKWCRVTRTRLQWLNNFLQSLLKLSLPRRWINCEDVLTNRFSCHRFCLGRYPIDVVNIFATVHASNSGCSLFLKL